MEQLVDNRRGIKRIVVGQETSDGAGVRLTRVIGGPQLPQFDPFLLLDHFVSDDPNDYIGGFPPHPHRGFETVTYVVQGEIEHRDSAGNLGVIGPGDVQWMTAGDGIIHSEMPSARIQTEGGMGHGLQVWVNLPSTLRRTAPNYQALPHDRLAMVEGEGWAAEVVAGTVLGVEGPAKTHTPVGYARVTVQPGASLRIPIAGGQSQEALEEINRLLKAGEVVCLFPEGAISRSGQLGEFKTGFERSVEGVDGIILPFYLRGLWGSRFSRSSEKLRQIRNTRLRNEVIVAFGAPLPWRARPPR